MRVLINLKAANCRIVSAVGIFGRSLCSLIKDPDVDIEENAEDAVYDAVYGYLILAISSSNYSMMHLRLTATIPRLYFLLQAPLILPLVQKNKANHDIYPCRHEVTSSHAIPH